MRVFDWLRENFGLMPLYDYDLLDEPPATVTALCVRPVATSHAPVDETDTDAPIPLWPVDFATDLDFLRSQLTNAVEILTEVIGFVNVVRETTDRINR